MTAAKSQKNTRRGGRTAKRFVIINEYNPQNVRKEKFLWTVVGVFTLVLLAFSIRTFKNSAVQSSVATDEQTKSLGRALGETAEKVKDAFASSSADGQMESNQAIDAAAMEKIKSEIMARIEKSLVSDSWVSHTSTDLGLIFRYPVGWSLTEKSGAVAIEFKTASSTDGGNAERGVHLEISQAKTGASIAARNSAVADVISNENKIIMTRYAVADGKIDWLVVFNRPETEEAYYVGVNFDDGEDIYASMTEAILATIGFLE